MEVASFRGGRMAGKSSCQHDELLLECSPWAKEAGFERPDAAKRMAAAARTGRNPFAAKEKSVQAIKKLGQEAAERLSPSFPGPLLLPNDELNWDPDYTPQSFRSWLMEGDRNKLTQERKTLYVVAPPSVTPAVNFIQGWVQPATAVADNLRGLEPPSADASLQYLSAFYHGLPVQRFPERLRFVPWTEPSRRGGPKHNHDYIGLACGDSCTRIRTRETPDGKFKRQLNLEDLIDAAIEMLPEDAYAIVLLMNLDMYEDADDDFCCGRAYGGSRVCVVSSARYHPALDVENNIDREHMWPASHCKKFADALCAVEGLKPRKHVQSIYETINSPLRRAVGAIRRDPAASPVEDEHGLWFSRVARTVVHELGHCFGIDHCSYYACNMQGTSGILEDIRQPPYFCPVCLEKIAYAIACELQAGDQPFKEEYIRERYKAIAGFCEKWKDINLFVSYQAWIQALIR
ncbi:hypothetical protein SAMD00023353_2100490 [Rosellinia necatrix]|uniref:Archaemetzincin-2 n=1 Tax=Rosellinia necatrix TaxID=77044 RepID=A0A1W2TFI2_ROSNE|nr:hypothetical protein SAMD00023353_2100490 [Rosellinia necatrix]